MGIPGGRRKIKSKELLDMKKEVNIQKGSRRKIKSKELLDMKKGGNIQKGGGPIKGPFTNPDDRTYFPTAAQIRTAKPALSVDESIALSKSDGEVLDAIRKCEATHFNSARQITGFKYANTDSRPDIGLLRKCIGEKLFTAPSGVLSYKKSSALVSRPQVAVNTAGIDFANPTCTTADDTRVDCPLPKRPTNPDSPGKPLWTPGGGSRKKSSRPKAKRNTIKKK